VYRQSNLVMDPGHRLYWQLLLPVVLVTLSRPLTPDDPVGSAAGQRRILNLTALALAAVTVVAWDPTHLTAAVVVGAGIVYTAVTIGISRRANVAVAVAAVGMATAIGFGESADLVGLMAYRYRLDDAHEALGKAIAETALPDGAVAFGDAGVLPYTITQRVVDSSGLATVEAARGGVDAVAFLDTQNVKLVVLISKDSTPGSLLRFDAQPALYDFVQSKGAAFVAGSGPVFGPGYHLNYWMSQDWVRAGLKAKFDRVVQVSEQNDIPDAAVFRNNLLSFPFLNGKP
jgi:hypothetical protein